MISDLFEIFWGKARRIRSLEGPNVAELQKQGNKEMCLVFVGTMIYMPHRQCQFMVLGSGWVDRKDLPIRSFQLGVIQWWSEDLLWERGFSLVLGKHTNGVSRNRP